MILDHKQLFCMKITDLLKLVQSRMFKLFSFWPIALILSVYLWVIYDFISWNWKPCSMLKLNGRFFTMSDVRLALLNELRNHTKTKSRGRDRTARATMVVRSMAELIIDNLTFHVPDGTCYTPASLIRRLTAQRTQILTAAAPEWVASFQGPSH